MAKTYLTSTKRAREGLFLGFQYPTEIPGVAIVSFEERIQYTNKSLMENKNREVFLTVKEFPNISKRNPIAGLQSTFLADI